jgi:hypothetical protein
MRVEMNTRISAFLIYSIVAISALIISLKTTFGLLGIDSDSAGALTIWYGIKTGGWGWMRDFSFTSDNWVLSVFPFNFLCFYLFGPKPALIIFSGWLFQVASAILAGIMSYQLKARFAAMLVPVLLVCIGTYAQSAGFVAYAASHDITNLYGLGSLVLLLKWINLPKAKYLIAILLLESIGAISDPWLLAAYDLPMIIIAIRYLYSPTRNISRHQAVMLLSAQVVVIFLAKTHLFGILGFLPNPDFSLGSRSVIINNFVFLIRDLGGLLNVVPGNSNNHFFPSLISLSFLLTGLTINLFVFFLKGFRDEGVLTFLVFAMVSSSTILLSFLIIDIANDTGSARFLVNVVYLLVVSLAVLTEVNWRYSLLPVRLINVAAAVLFLLSGLISTYPIWAKTGFAMRDEGVLDILGVLQKNGLTYGYGPYHGAEANAVSVVSQGKVIIRPVLFNQQNGMMKTITRAQSSGRWFRPEDYPASQKSFFVVITTDPEACPDLNLCISGVKAQFGPPIKILNLANGTTVLIWDHPLLGYPYQITGIWGAKGWAWIGRSVTITTHQHATLFLKGAFPDIHVTINLNGIIKSLDIPVGTVERIDLPDNSVARIVTSGSLVTQKVPKKMYHHEISLLMLVPQPAP